MKKSLLFFLFSGCLLLCACAKATPTWEYVSDSLLTEAPAEAAQYCISFDVPEDAVLDEADGGKSVYRQKDGDYEIVSQTIGSCDLDTVVRTLSGFSPEQLQILHTSRYGMDECHFVWCSETEQGMKLSRADAILTGPYCYALTFSADEDAAVRHTEAQEQVFSTFCLSQDEGF